MLLAVLPKRSSDELSGELFVAAYQRKLGHYCDDAMTFLADKAMERCQWFPTIAECIEILGDWRRSDEHTERKWAADRIAFEERQARQRDQRDWHTVERQLEPITQEQVDQMTEQMQSIGLACKALMRDETGKVVPWAAKPGEEIY